MHRGQAVGCIAVAALLVMVASCGTSNEAEPASGPATMSQPAGPTTATLTAVARSAGAAFLDDYVTEDGRVLRHDQGDDIVSEGQAYGMLIAELADQPATARTIWRWTARHLQRPDHLLAYHADASGKILDRAPATDADTLAAFALLRYRGAGRDTLHAAGRRLAAAVLERETVTDASGRLIPVAGTWATGPPAVVNPSYWMPSVYKALARRADDSRWRDVARTTVSLVAAATQSGGTLPPDWGQLAGSAIIPTASPDGSISTQYGLDAQRVPIWFAAGCGRTAHSLAAAWWDLLSEPDRSGAIALTLDGDVVNAAVNPLPLLASAATARAAGDADQAAALEAQAARQAHSTPTYYGDSWLALAPAVADGSLVRCR
jgi:endoglucanase